MSYTENKNLNIKLLKDKLQSVIDSSLKLIKICELNGIIEVEMLHYKNYFICKLVRLIQMSTSCKAKIVLLEKTGHRKEKQLKNIKILFNEIVLLEAEIFITINKENNERIYVDENGQLIKTK